MHPNHKSCASFTSFALKSLNFAQILENSAQSCSFTTLAFRSSVSATSAYNLKLGCSCLFRVALTILPLDCPHHSTPGLPSPFYSWIALTILPLDCPHHSTPGLSSPFYPSSQVICSCVGRGWGQNH